MGSSAGYHKNWGTVAGDTASGAASGAAIGSVIPGVGTGIGAGVGAAAGFLTGLLTGDSPDAMPPPTAPPPLPDYADEISQRAAIAKQARLMASGTGQFLSGPLGAGNSGAKAPAAGGI